MVDSGIAPLDQHFGGMIPGRLHLLTGGPGTGKSTACLQFLQAGLRQDEPVALVTLNPISDLDSHGAFIGFDLEPALRSGRMVLLRFRAEFTSLLTRAGLPGRVVDDLFRQIATLHPTRLVIDPLTPFLTDGTASGSALAALAQWLDGLGVTTFVTCAADVSDHYDARLDPIVQRAAVIVHFARRRGGAGEMNIVQSRARPTPTSKIPFVLKPGLGLAAVDESELPPAQPEPHFDPIEPVVFQRPVVALAIEPPVAEQTISEPPAVQPAIERPVVVTRGGRARVRMLHTTPAPSDELAALLRRDYEVIAQREPHPGEAANIADDDANAILIETSHQSLEAAVALVSELGRRTYPAALIVVAERRLRSTDCAQLLRAGADELLSGDMSGAELLERISGAILRGHRAVVDEPHTRDLVLTKRSGNGSGPQLLDRKSMARAIASRVRSDRDTQFAVVTFSSPRSTSSSLHELALVALRSMRAASGDLAGVIDDRVVVCLQDARPRDAAPFIERVRTEWSRTHRSALRIETMAYPVDERRLRTLIEITQPS